MSGEKAEEARVRLVKAARWAERYVRGVRGRMPAGTNFHEDYLLDALRDALSEHEIPEDAETQTTDAPEAA